MTGFGSTAATVNATVQGGGAIATALAPAAAVPIIGAGVAAVGLALSFIFNRKRGRQKVAATQLVDELEPNLKQNVDAYLAGPRTASSQAQALNNFDSAWAWLSSADACGNAELGTPGKNCISERARGGRWDWFSLYRDPIANDPDVRPDSVATTLGLPEIAMPDLTKLVGGGSSIVPGLALIAAALLL